MDDLLKYALLFIVLIITAFANSPIQISDGFKNASGTYTTLDVGFYSSSGVTNINIVNGSGNGSTVDSGIVKAIGNKVQTLDRSKDDWLIFFLIAIGLIGAVYIRTRKPKSEVRG